MSPVAHARARAALIGLTLGVLVGCGATGSGPSAPETAPASSAISTLPDPSVPTDPPVSTVGPDAPPSASAQVTSSALPDGDQPVYPGRYTTQFRPALLLAIARQVEIDCAPGYRCHGDVDVNSTAWLDLEFGHDDPVEIQLMGFEKVYDPNKPGKVIDPPADLAAWVSAFPGVTVLDRQSVEIGGVAGTRLDVRTSRDVPFGPTGLADLPSLGFGKDQLHRVFVVGVHRAAVVIALGSILEGDATPERQTVANDVLQPIVDSITWQ